MVRCNKYTSLRDANRPSLHAMQDMAYILTESGPMKTMGFIKAKDWRKAHKRDGADILPPGVPDWD